MHGLVQISPRWLNITQILYVIIVLPLMVMRILFYSPKKHTVRKRGAWKMQDYL